MQWNLSNTHLRGLRFATLCIKPPSFRTNFTQFKAEAIALCVNNLWWPVSICIIATSYTNTHGYNSSLLIVFDGSAGENQGSGGKLSGQENGGSSSPLAGEEREEGQGGCGSGSTGT